MLAAVRIRPVLRVPIMSALRFNSSEGATGSGFSRAGGAQSGDSFTRREKAAEDLYVRQMEQQKLKELKEKLRKQRAHLDELDSHIDELTKSHADRNSGKE